MKTTIIHILFIIIAGFAVYANALQNDFIWDDEVLIQRNAYLTSWCWLKQIFTSNAFGGGSEGGQFYRPLQILSYRLDYILWQLNPVGYHLTNIAIHLANCLIIYFFITALSGKKTISFISALLFTIHPVNTEAVTYTAGRADLILVFYLSLSLLLFQKFIISENKYCLAASVLGYGLSLFSKESALIFPAIILFYYYCFPAWKNKKIAAAWIPFLILALGYLAFHLLFLRLPRATTLSLIYSASVPERILTAVTSFGRYILLVIFPQTLHMERHFITSSAADPGFICGLIISGLFIWILLRTRREERLIFFFLGWFLINIVPLLNICFPLNASLAEHWLYPAAPGLLAAICFFLSKLSSRLPSAKNYNLLAVRRPFLYVLLSCYLFYFSGKTVVRNAQWRDSFTLFSHDLRYSPNSFLLHNNLGVACTRRGNLEKAEKEFALAALIQPRYGIAHNNLGVCYERKKMYNKAITEYLAAINLNRYVLAYENLGRLYLKLNRPKQALIVLEDGCQRYPLSRQMQYLLTIAYDNLGEKRNSD